MEIFKILYLSFLISNLLVYSNYFFSMENNTKITISKQFLLALQRNNIKTIKEFINKNLISVNFKYENNDTPLIFACIFGHKEIAELLIKNNANINHKADGGLTPLIAASREGYTKIVELLIAKKVDINQNDSWGVNALIAALSNGHKNIVEILIDNGADKNHCDTTYTTYLFCLNQFEDDKDENINKTKEETFKRLLNCIDNINILKNDQTILMKSISYESKKFNHEKIIAILLESGANINAKNRLLQSVYFFANQHNKKEIIFDYVNKIFNEILKTIKNEKNLTLQQCFLKFKVLLLRIGSIKITDKNGNNLLHHAIILGNFEFFKIIYWLAPELIAKANNSGEMPLCLIFNNYDCAQKIFDAIKKLN